MPDLALTIQPPAELAATIQPPAQATTALAIGQGPAGPAGATGPAGGDVHALAAVDLAAGRAVVIDATTGKLEYASADNLAHVYAIAGITAAAALSGASAIARRSGQIESNAWNWAPGPVYLGQTGELTQSIAGLSFVQVVGRGEGARLAINLQPPMLLN